MTHDLETSTPMDRPPVELVEEIPSPEAAARKAFVAGAISAGVVCAVIGTVVGFVLGVQSSLPTRPAQKDRSP